MISKNTILKLVKKIKKYFKGAKINKAVIGLSGGVDSAVTAALAAKALGCKNVTALIMPYQGISSKENINHAKKIAKKLKIKTYFCPINSLIDVTGKLPWEESNIAKENTMARARAVILYNFANSHNAMVLGTGNKSELYLGYYTKYGDAAVDLLVIGGLWKTEVWELANLLKLPKFLLEKPPTAELSKGQTDEAELGASYKVLDKILKKLIEKNKSVLQIIKSGFEKSLVETVFRRIKQNEHKSKPPEILTV